MDYFAADRAAEDERLLAQSRLFDPLTRRVLDLGSGAGNVTNAT